MSNEVTPATECESPPSELMLDDRVKGMPGGMEPLPLGSIGQQNWNLLREDLPLPLAVLKSSALEQNSRWMRRFTKNAEVALCPHGKTTMSPELHRRQLKDGAWGITLATIGQVQVARRYGVKRILLANQLVGRHNIRFILDELHRDPEFDFYCLVDSTEGAQLLADAASRHPLERPVNALVEVGVAGARTGCRSDSEAIEVAKEVRASAPHLALRGVEGFEGVIAGSTPEERTRNVCDFLDRMASVAVKCDEADLWSGEPVILSAGGSVFFDLVVDRLKRVELTKRRLIVLRSGCYLTGDDGMYQEAFDNLAKRSAAARDIADPLSAALEVWAYVQSRPEFGLAVITLGRRDASFDAGFPAPKTWYRPRESTRPELLPGGETIVAMHDQHAVLQIPPSSPLQVGDMVGCGISHPCTTFDKWRVIPIVSDDYDVVDAVSTFF